MNFEFKYQKLVENKSKIFEVENSNLVKESVLLNMHLLKLFEKV